MTSLASRSTLQRRVVCAKRRFYCGGSLGSREGTDFDGQKGKWTHIIPYNKAQGLSLFLHDIFLHKILQLEPLGSQGDKLRASEKIGLPCWWCLTLMDPTGLEEGSMAYSVGIIRGDSDFLPRVCFHGGYLWRGNLEPSLYLQIPYSWDSICYPPTFPLYIFTPREAFSKRCNYQMTDCHKQEELPKPSH